MNKMGTSERFDRNGLPRELRVYNKLNVKQKIIKRLGFVKVIQQFYEKDWNLTMLRQKYYKQVTMTVVTYTTFRWENKR